MSQDTRDLLEFLKWAVGYIVVGLGFTMPLWGSLIGLI